MLLYVLCWGVQCRPLLSFDMLDMSLYVLLCRAYVITCYILYCMVCVCFVLYPSVCIVGLLLVIAFALSVSAILVDIIGCTVICVGPFIYILLYGVKSVILCYCSCCFILCVSFHCRILPLYVLYCLVVSVRVVLCCAVLCWFVPRLVLACLVLYDMFMRLCFIVLYAPFCGCDSMFDEVWFYYVICVCFCLCCVYCV